MQSKVKIAVDAMGGENSPKKIIEGIKISLKKNNDNFFHLYGNENSIRNEMGKNKLLSEHCEIINTNKFILDKESPLAAAKKGKVSCVVLRAYSRICMKRFFLGG